MDFQTLTAPMRLTVMIYAKKCLYTYLSITCISFSVQTISVHYEDVQPVCDTPTHSVLFLHSGVFTSAVWLDTLTMYHLAKQGYRAVAIDLPGD